jgi:hypothetical protein
VERLGLGVACAPLRVKLWERGRRPP